MGTRCTERGLGRSHLGPAEAFGVAAQVQVDSARGGDSVHVAVGGEATGVDDDQVRHERVQVGWRYLDLRHAYRAPARLGGGSVGVPQARGRRLTSMFFMNRAWYAREQSTRTLTRYLGSQPA